MSKSNKNNLSSSLSSKTAPSNRGPQGFWKRLKRKATNWLSKYAKSAKTFNFTFISFDGKFLKWLVWFLIALSMYILVCHHCGIPPSCLFDKVIELIKTFVQ